MRTDRRRLARVKLRRRFLIASMILLTIFCLNLYGLYGDGLVKRYYLIPEIEHLAAGFFLAMWISCFFRSTWLIMTGLVVFTLMWEGLEFYIATVPAATEAVKNTLKLSDTSVHPWDTALDVALNSTGASIFLYFRGHYFKQNRNPPIPLH